MQKVIQKSKKIGQIIADFFFPNFCFGCGSTGSLFCSTCTPKVPYLFYQTCFECQRNHTRFGELCFDCLPKAKSHSLDALFGATCYQVPVIKKMLHAYKYQFVQDLALPLGRLTLEAIEKSNLPLPTLVIPVPLHKSRHRFRGFNQSALLAHYLTEHLEILTGKLHENILIRKVKTASQQKTTSKEERRENLKNAFTVENELLVKDGIIWLIDDVATTGSTLKECGRALKKAGAQKVYAVVLARD